MLVPRQGDLGVAMNIGAVLVMGWMFAAAVWMAGSVGR